MKIILTIALSFFALTILAQDRIYTKGLANGYAWTAQPSVSSPVYAKEESLLASLQQRNILSEIDSSINKRSFPLDCDSDINKLREENISTDIKNIVIQIDNFYTVKENLIVPVLGAYCYSVKKLAGVSSEGLEICRQKLLEYSTQK